MLCMGCISTGHGGSMLCMQRGLHCTALLEGARRRETVQATW